MPSACQAKSDKQAACLLMFVLWNLRALRAPLPLRAVPPMAEKSA
jgi:hypothetical protein